MDCAGGEPVFDLGDNNNSFNWIVELTLNKMNSPDNACQPSTVYLWSLHWSVMSITSIGSAGRGRTLVKRLRILWHT